MLSVFKCIGSFIAFMFRKTQYDWVIADIFCLGSAVRNSLQNVSDFIPSHML